MEAEIRDLIQALHDEPPQIVFVTAGAGSQALTWLLGVAGASRTLLEALVPYASAAFDEFLGQTPVKYVERRPARLLAGRALTRARWLRPEPGPTIGLACTATIVTDRPKRGDHRAHIATWQPERVVSCSLNLAKGARDRAGEEGLVSRLILNQLARAYGLPHRLTVDLGPDDRLEETTYDLAAAVSRLLDGDVPAIGIHADGRIRERLVQPQALLSGAFNPLHSGHRQLAAAAAEWLHRPVAFELSVRNVDKPALTRAESLERLVQFAGRYAVFASRAPTFLEKATLYPGCTFIVGYDTALRVFEPRYYDGSSTAMRAALATIREQGCRFLVAGRSDGAGRFQAAEQLPAPAEFSDLFAALPASRFRVDISSTDLRATGRRPQWR